MPTDQIPPAPDPLSPEYTIRVLTDMAMVKLLENPATDPDLTVPDATTLASRGLPPRGSQTSIIHPGLPQPVAPKDAPGGDQMAHPPLGVTQTVPSSTAHFTDQELTDEARKALDVLQRDGLVEQVDDHSWRFK
jgi:hypothetical protein